uniref:Transposase n=1 Tax=Heterorhabditis bacteriophora TaxID=37862 RepID=A0A1I7W8U0_HETBA
MLNVLDRLGIESECGELGHSNHLKGRTNREIREAGKKGNESNAKADLLHTTFIPQT